MSTKKLYPVLQEGQDVIIDQTGEKGKIIQLPNILTLGIKYK